MPQPQFIRHDPYAGAQGIAQAGFQLADSVRQHRQQEHQFRLENAAAEFDMINTVVENQYQGNWREFAKDNPEALSSVFDHVYDGDTEKVQKALTAFQEAPETAAQAFTAAERSAREGGLERGFQAFDEGIERGYEEAQRVKGVEAAQIARDLRGPRRTEGAEGAEEPAAQPQPQPQPQDPTGLLGADLGQQQQVAGREALELGRSLREPAVFMQQEIDVEDPEQLREAIKTGTAIQQRLAGDSSQLAEQERERLGKYLEQLNQRKDQAITFQYAQDARAKSRERLGELRTEELPEAKQRAAQAEQQLRQSTTHDTVLERHASRQRHAVSQLEGEEERLARQQAHPVESPEPITTPERRQQIQLDLQENPQRSREYWENMKVREPQEVVTYAQTEREAGAARAIEAAPDEATGQALAKLMQGEPLEGKEKRRVQRANAEDEREARKQWRVAEHERGGEREAALQRHADTLNYFEEHGGEMQDLIRGQMDPQTLEALHTREQREDTWAQIREGARQFDLQHGLNRERLGLDVQRYEMDAAMNAAKLMEMNMAMQASASELPEGISDMVDHKRGLRSKMEEAAISGAGDNPRDIAEAVREVQNTEEYQGLLDFEIQQYEKLGFSPEFARETIKEGSRWLSVIGAGGGGLLAGKAALAASAGPLGAIGLGATGIIGGSVLGDRLTPTQEREVRTTRTPEQPAQQPEKSERQLRLEQMTQDFLRNH